MYADGLVLLSSSFNVLQQMINICGTEADCLDMKSNVKRSMIVHTGPIYKCECVNVTLNGPKLPFVDKARYLGVFLTASKMI